MKVVRVLIFSMVLIAGAAATIGFGEQRWWEKLLATGLLCAAEWSLLASMI